MTKAATMTVLYFFCACVLLVLLGVMQVDAQEEGAGTTPHSGASGLSPMNIMGYLFVLGAFIKYHYNS